MTSCYRRCSSAGVGDHEESCYCEYCGAIADAAEHRCRRCADLDQGWHLGRTQPVHMLGLLHQLPSELQYDVDVSEGPWALLPREDPAAAERRQSRQCATMHVWCVYQAWHVHLERRHLWTKIAVETSLTDAKSAVKKVAPDARYDADWVRLDDYELSRWIDDDYHRFFSGKLSFIVVRTLLNVWSRRG